jgi:hypothetical protein
MATAFTIIYFLVAIFAMCLLYAAAREKDPKLACLAGALAFVSFAMSIGCQFSGKVTLDAEGINTIQKETFDVGATQKQTVRIEHGFYLVSANPATYINICESKNNCFYAEIGSDSKYHFGTEIDDGQDIGITPNSTTTITVTH